MMVSSANVANVVCSVEDKSAVYRRYRSGPSKLPCGTPEVMHFGVVSAVRNFTWKCLSIK